MKLVADKVLEESPIVANCRMNRERNLSNGYDVELRFKPLEYLATTIKRVGKARWLDLCCGTGKALIHASKVADAENLPLEVIGVDLAGLFLPSNSSRLTLLQASLSDWQPEASFDLITCIHGLHYIGDKLGLIARAGSWLTEQGRFTANLDTANIRLSNGQSSSRIVTFALRKAVFDYSSRNKLIQCEGRHAVQLPFRLDQPFVANHRRELLSRVGGETLEIGFGTGLNLSCYPKEVRKITVVDPNPGMHRRAQKRIQQADIEVDKRVLSSEELPFETAAFDCVVSTFTLCSIQQVDRALAEVFRVLKPEGRLLVLEHGLSNEPSIQKRQRRLNGIQRLLADNCRLDRNIEELLRQQPFQSVELEEFYLEKTPKTHGYMYRGVATK